MTTTNLAAEKLYLLMMANSRAYEQYEQSLYERNDQLSAADLEASREMRSEALKARAAAFEFALLHLG